jgi:hypothetical protein
MTDPLRPGQEHVPTQPGERQHDNDEHRLALERRQFHRSARYFRRQIDLSQNGAGASGVALPGAPAAEPASPPGR